MLRTADGQRLGDKDAGVRAMLVSWEWAMLAVGGK